MKKGLIAGVIIAVLVVGGVFFVKQKGGMEKGLQKDQIIKVRQVSSSNINLFSAQTDLFYSFFNLDKTIKSVQSSNFWKEIVSLDLWKNLDVAENLQKVSAAFNETIGITFSADELVSLVGEEISIGITMQGAAPIVTLVTKVAKDAQLEGKIKTIIEKSKEQGDLTKETYQSSELLFVKSKAAEQPNLGVVFLDNNTVAMVIGGEMQQLKDIVDRKAGLKDGLEKNPEFVDLFKGKVSGDGMFFINVGAITTPGDVAGIATSLLGAGSPDIIKTIGGDIAFDQGVNVRFNILPNKGKMSEEMLALWAVKPRKATSLKYMPEKTLFYSGTTFLDFKMFFNSWKKSLTEQKTAEADSALAVLDDLKKKNIDIENELIPSLGTEFSFFCTALSAEGMFPEIEIGAMIGLKNKATINEQMKAVVSYLGSVVAQSFGAGEETSITLETEKEQYGDIAIERIKLPIPGSGFSPCYAIIDEFLVIATSVNAVKKLVDVSKGKMNSIKQDPDYSRINDIITPETNQIGYINVEKMLTASISICDWIVSFQSLSMPKGDTQEDQLRRAEIEQTAAVIKQSVIPVLKVLKVIKVLGSNTLYADDDSMKQVFKLNIEDTKQAA